MKAKWERSISIFTKQVTTVTWAVFQNAGEVKGERGRCGGGKEDKSLEVPTCSIKSNADFHTRGPSKLVAAVPVSGWKKLHRLLCLLHSLRTVHPSA